MQRRRSIRLNAVRQRRCGVTAALGVTALLLGACGDGTHLVVDPTAPAVLDTVPVPAMIPAELRSVTAAQPVVAELVAKPAERPPVTVTVPRPLRRATLVFTGDTLIHTPLVRQAQHNAGGNGYDFAPMFARVRGLISAADLAVCHLETPVAPPGEAVTSAPRYGVPAEIAGGLASAGYDRCSTASNHSMDRGVAGIDATVSALTDAGISQTGMARTPDESSTTLVNVNGIVVAHISYTFGLNGLRRPADEPWRVSMIDDGGIIDAARDARSEGADVVILSLHWGSEGIAEPTLYQRDVADWITATGAVGLVVGHHAHVPQPVEQVNATWVAFGLGNILSSMPTDAHWPASSQDGVILVITDRAEGWVVRPVVADLADPNVSDATKRQLQRSLHRAIALYGDMVAPV